MLKQATIAGISLFQGDVILEFGKITSFIGVNGSGKTTLIAALERALRFCFDFKYGEMSESLEHSLEWKHIRLVFDLSGKVDADNMLKAFQKIDSTFSLSENAELKVIVCLKSPGQAVFLDSLEVNCQQFSVIKDQNDVRKGAKADEENFKQRIKSKREVERNRQELHAGPLENRGLALEQFYRLLNSPHLENLSVDDLTKLQDEAHSLGLKDHLGLERGRDNCRFIVELEHIRTVFKALFPPKRRVTMILPHSEMEAELDKIILDACDSKVGKNPDYHNLVCKQLSDFLQSDIQIYRNNGVQGFPRFEIDGQNYNRIHVSNGTRTTIDHYVRTHIEGSDIVLWDEPENGLHATRKAKVVELMENSRKQFIISTHSPEMVRVFSDLHQIYRMKRIREKDNFRLDYEPMKNRSSAFRAAEDLGIRPSTTLFTADAVLWVEGPTDWMLWQAWLRDINKKNGGHLTEGYDYSVLFYGGANIKHIEVKQEPTGIGVDLLSLCSRAIVLCDSDRREANGKLKENIKLISAQVANVDKAELITTDGREIENYLPILVVRKVINKLADVPREDLDDLKIDKFDSVYEVIEKHLIDKEHRSSNPERAKNHTVWNNKVGFVRAALEEDGGNYQSLVNGGKEAVEKVFKLLSRD